MDIRLVFPHQDIPQTTMNNLSEVEIISFISWDWETLNQLFKRNEQPKMLILRNPIYE